MTTAGPGLMKLPSLGSSAFDNQIPTTTSTVETLAERRRASITDPCLHAHSTVSQVSPPGNSPSAQDQSGGRSYTLPSFRELSRHSNSSVFVSHPAQSPNALQVQPPFHSLDHASADPTSAPRRGSAADLDHILLNSNADFERPNHSQPTADHPASPTAHLSLSDQQGSYSPLSHPTQPYSFNSFSFDSSLPPVHLPSQPPNAPVSPRSFSSVPQTNQSEPSLLPVGPGANRRPAFVRRRSCRAHELDMSTSEDPARSMMGGPGATHNGPDHPRAAQPPLGSQWPYPTLHHRHHLQKPSAPVKRRGSSQSIPESSATPSNCFNGLPPDQSYGPIDQPWNTYRMMASNSQREAVGDTPSILRSYRLDARRQSEASSVSSTGLTYDRRQSGESGECDGPDDIHNLPPIHSLRRRSWSSSSKQSVPPFSPNQPAVATCMSDYALPPLPYKEQSGPAAAFTTPASGEHVMLGDNGGWYNSLDDQTVAHCGPGVEDVYELKDKLAATRLLDRHPPHSHPAPERAVPSAPGVGQVNQQDKPSNPYSRSPELKISHKLAERKRRKEMRDLFDELRDVLPAVDERHAKGSKWETLSRAVDYMQQLKLENEKLRNEKIDLQRQLNTPNRGVINSQEGQNNNPQ